MEKEMKIYHVETQEDYNDLMVKLENEGYTWVDNRAPTDGDYWTTHGEETIIYLGKLGEGIVTRSYLSGAERNYPHIKITKYKAKGVKQMEKVVVPQFVADWFEEHKSISLYKTINRYLNNVGMSCELSQWQDSFGKSFKENVNEVEEVIAKMHLYGYEIEVEKKYNWRKKKEYLCIFEEREELYLNVNKETGKLSFESKIEIGIMQTILTETEVRRMVSKEDFIKLEKVEITE